MNEAQQIATQISALYDWSVDDDINAAIANVLERALEDVAPLLLKAVLTAMESRGINTLHLPDD